MKNNRACSDLGIRRAGVNMVRALIALATVTLGLSGGAAQAQLRYSGSDTVEPVIEAAVTAFARGNRGYKVQVQALGTSSGFRELCSSRSALVGASRPIKPDEVQQCAASGVSYVDLPVALDAVVLVVSAKNTWLKDLSLAELRTIFEYAAAGKVTSWKQVRAAFPDQALRTAGPGIKHGTFGFFGDVVGLKGLVRSDFKDFDSHAGTGRFVAAEAGAIGFMPLGEAKAFEGQVRTIAVDLGKGPVQPSAEEVLAGRYDKLSRQVFVFLNPAMIAKTSAVDQSFVKNLVTDLEKYVRYADLIALQPAQYQENIRRAVGNR